MQSWRPRTAFQYLKYPEFTDYYINSIYIIQSQLYILEGKHFSIISIDADTTDINDYDNSILARIARGASIPDFCGISSSGHKYLFFKKSLNLVAMLYSY